MLKVDTIHEVRIAHFVDGKGIREIAGLCKLSRNTVRTIIRSGKTDQTYERREQPRPKLGVFVDRLVELLSEDEVKPVKHRRRSQILFEQLQREGYEGSYIVVDSIKKFGKVDINHPSQTACYCCAGGLYRLMSAFSGVKPVGTCGSNSGPSS